MEYLESEQNYQRKYEEGLFKLLLDITIDFPFSQPEGEPPAEAREVSHESQLKKLIRSVRLTALRTYKQIPPEVRMGEDEKDWIQKAFEILYWNSLNYQPKAGYFYDIYMKFLVFKRLKSKQRAAFNKNPADDEKLRKIAAALERKLGRKITARDIIDATGIGIEKAQSFLDSGSGPRMFQEWKDTRDLEAFEKDDDGSASSSPEKACQRKDFIRALLECLEKLQPYQRGIVIERFLEAKPFAEIAARCVGKTVEAIRNHARRGFTALRDCVLKRYEMGIQA